MVMSGQTIALEIFLEYKAVNNRRYTYEVYGVYARNLRSMFGPARKATPA